MAKGDADAHDLHLALSHDERLELRVVAAGHALRGGHAVCADWLKLDTTSPAGRRINQPLFKAVGVRKGNPWRPAVVDATGGLGEDAWLLAAAGCRVTVIERSAVVHALLQDAWRRARQAQRDITDRITLQHADAAAWLADTAHHPKDSSDNPGNTDEQRRPRSQRPDVVYLDPMFPPGRKTLEKKPMRVLRWLVGDDADAATLLPAALRAAGKRVVVKRPRHAPTLSNTQPTHTHDQGKALRFDVYLP